MVGRFFRNGRGTGQTTRGDRTERFCFFSVEIVVSDRVERVVRVTGGGRQTPRTSPRKPETRRDERARTSTSSCALRLFPDAGAGGSSVRSTIVTSAFGSAFASGAAGGLGETGFLAPPPKKLRMSPGIAPDAGPSRAPPRKRSTSLACPGVARSPRGAYAMFEMKIFFSGCQARQRPEQTCRDVKVYHFISTPHAASSRLPLNRRRASARSDASTASSSPWLPSRRPPPWPPPPSCSPARREAQPLPGR